MVRLPQTLDRMKSSARSSGLWLSLLLLVTLFAPFVPMLLGHHDLDAHGIPPRFKPWEYGTRFVLEAALYSLVGVFVARWIQDSACAGLFAISLGIAYVAYVELIGSALWYYTRSHSTMVDHFFLVAPMLAPVVFPTAACLLWHIVRVRKCNAV